MKNKYIIINHSVNIMINSFRIIIKQLTRVINSVLPNIFNLIIACAIFKYIFENIIHREKILKKTITSRKL